MPSHHNAAILPQKGGPLEVQQRVTPEPGPNEVLIEVKAVALNPVDHYQRDRGFPPPPSYPYIIGNDVSGVVAKVGADLKASVPEVGGRVMSFASSFYEHGSLDHGGFQQYVLAKSEGVIALPDDLSFEQGAVFPLAVQTALTAYTTVDIPLGTRYSPQDKQAILIWGASSSVGVYAVQSAVVLGYTVYAVSSAKQHALVRKLGAHAVFDYHDADVVQQIVAAVKKDGVELTTAHAVVDNSLQPVLDVLKETKGSAPGRVAHSPVLLEGHPTLDNTVIRFNMPPADPVARSKHIGECFHDWLAVNLKSGKLVPSPAIQIEPRGLENLNAALDKLRAGVSGTKIVVPL